MQNLDLLHQFIEKYNFATLISHAKDDELCVSHIPVMLNQSQGPNGSLSFHLAKKNPHVNEIDGLKGALFIFHGPHAYISPEWYKTSPAVPTWNYAVVRVQGKPKIISEDQLASDLSRLMIQHEGNSNYQIPEDYQSKLMSHIVGFSMEIEKIDSTFKLGQNRSKEDQEGMLLGLSGQSDEAALALADFIQKIQATTS